MRAATLLLAAVHFVCPLLFFTDLTRNPYITQIALLHMGVCAAGALWLLHGALSGGWTLPRTPLDLPWAFWLGACVLSWALSYFGHAAFYRESIASEGFRVFYFTVVNGFFPFLLAAVCAGDLGEEAPSAWGWAAFSLFWGALWLAFPQMRSGTAAGVARIWPHVWDPYGGLLWLGGTACVLWLARAGGVHPLWHAALSAGFLGAAYGVLQYFGFEFIWAKTLNPYGGRSVSTFGNPNFMSSYMVMLLPLAAAYYLKARARAQRVLYAVCFLTFEACLLCSLTRSSWFGAAAAFGMLALSPEVRRLLRADPEFTGLVGTAGLLMALLWPQSVVAGYGSSVIGRLSEMALIADKTSVYSPWWQRVLIWSCAWQMGAENPLFGKGFGLFELFYPFYQGHLLDMFEFFRIARTHANNGHNEIFEAWAQTGILGVGILLWTWTVFFRSVAAIPAKAPRGGKEAGGGGTSLWLYCSAAGVAGMLVDNLLNVSLHFAVPAFLFWWQAGIVMGRLSWEQGWTRRLSLPRPGALALAGVAALGLGWAGWQGVRMWRRETHYFMGFKLLRGSRFPQAIEQLELAYRAHPREVNTNYELGNAYARTDGAQKAVWAYREALKANAGYDEIYYNLASVLGNRLEDRDGALKNYLMSWLINPVSHDLHLSFATFLVRDAAKNRDLAVALLESSVRLFPDNPHFSNNLGYLYSLGREYEKAEQVYAGVLRRQPHMELAERNLRTSLAQSGRRPPEVLAQVGEFRRLEALLQARRYGPEALALARRVADHFPEDARSRFYLGNLELLSGDASKAEADLRRVLAKEPRNAAAMVNLAQALKRLGKAQEAAAILRSALALEPGNAAAAAELKALAQ